MASRKGKMFKRILGSVGLKVVAGRQIASTRIKKRSMRKTASKLGGKLRLSFETYTKGLMDLNNCRRLAGNLVPILTAAQEDLGIRLFKFTVFIFLSYPQSVFLNRLIDVY